MKRISIAERSKCKIICFNSGGRKQKPACYTAYVIALKIQMARAEKACLQ